MPHIISIVHYCNSRCASCGSSQALPHTTAQGNGLYEGLFMLINGIPLLLQIFDRMVFPTHACSHVQFLLFRLTSLHEVRGRVVHVQLCKWMVVVYSIIILYVDL